MLELRPRKRWLVDLVYLVLVILCWHFFVERPKPQQTQASTGSATPVSSATTARFSCAAGEPASGAVVDVKGSKHWLRAEPSATAEKVPNERASQALKTKEFHAIDSTTRVQLQCVSGDWAQIRIVEPEWLSDVVGWVERKALAEPRGPGEFRTFTAEDIIFDDGTRKYKTAIVKAVNRIHREDERCRDNLEPLVMRSQKSTPAKPVFFVTCRVKGEPVNVFFTPQDATRSQPMGAPQHIERSKAIRLCEAYAKQQAAHPSTVDFSYLMSLRHIEHANGRTTILSTFTARNAFNLEVKFDVRCLLDASGIIEGHITESQN